MTVAGVIAVGVLEALLVAVALSIVDVAREALDGALAPVRWFVFDAEALTHVDATGVDAPHLTGPVAG